MPDLDVSDVLLDPVLASRFTVNRRTETMAGNGRPVVTLKSIQNVVGIITSASPDDLERLDDHQRMGRNLVVVTKFRLIGPAPGKQPDTIEWQGNTFIVKEIDPYSQYGQGFIQAIVGSIDSIDQAAP